MPQLPTPAATGDVWGNNLNNFLRQLQNDSDGSINASSTRPTKTAADAGFTMVDTATREIIRWNGTAWEILMGGIDKGRPRLTTNTNIYLNGTTGDDNNNGLSTTTAFKTIDRCVAAVYALDLGNFEITINIAAGTYLGRFDFSSTALGANGSRIIIKGAGSNSTILQINSSFGETGAIINRSNNIVISGLKIEAIGTTGDFLRGLFQFGDGMITVGNDINFGNFAIGTNSQHMYCEIGRIYISSNYTISGGASRHIVASLGGQYPTYKSGPLTSTFVNNPNFAIFAESYFGVINPDLNFAGGATASVRASASAQAVIAYKSAWPGAVDQQFSGGIVYAQ